jgi:carboxyl-terminal processing protease
LTRSKHYQPFRKLTALVLLAVLVCTCTAAGAFAVSNRIDPPVEYTARKPLAAFSDVKDAIIKGDFENAAKLIEAYPDKSDRNLAKFKKIVDAYSDIEQSRKEKKKKAYDEKFAELDEIIKKEMPEEPNKIDEAFLAVLQVDLLADEKQKASLRKNPFVKALVVKTLEKGKELEANGDWVDAYAHSYYWLNAFYEKTKEYKKHSEKLTEKAVIEMSLKDNTCETSAQRHEGIKKQQFFRALKALDFSYVNKVSYGEMAVKGVERCRILGDVLVNTNEDLPYQIDENKAKLWDNALKILKVDTSASKADFTESKLKNLLEQIIALNEATVNIPVEVVIAQFTEAAFESLDPFTTIVWPWSVRDFQKNMTQNFEGIGVQISKVRGVLTVSTLLPDTPAYNSGLDAEDSILAVDGEPTKDMTLNCAVSNITGPKGTDVTLTVRHKDAPEGETEEITITRGRIDVQTVRGWQRTEKGTWRHMVDPENRIGYLKVTGFTGSTAKNMEKILKDLEAQSIQGLIFDLRDNPGGYLTTAAALVDMFVSKGLIVKSQPRWGIPTYETAHKKGTHPNYPLVVLINGRSASASEIVSGALQDEKYKRATIVGKRSYGKGSVQTITPYSGEGSQLKYTMAYYHLPSDQRVKNRYIMEKEGRTDWGIAPDVEVELANSELRKLIEVQMINEKLVKADHKEAVERSTLQETLETDAQLNIGLLVLKAKIIAAGGEVKFTKPEPKVEAK